MKKEIYEIPTLELLRFEITNVVTTSIYTYENYPDVTGEEFDIPSQK